MVELPADLGCDGFWPVRVRKADGADGIPGGTEGMGAHVADRDALAGGAGGGRCRRSLHLTGTDATGKPPTNLLGSMELSAGERAGPGDERPRAVISWRLSLKQPEHPLCAVGGPGGHQTSVGFAERLWRPHHPTLHSGPDYLTSAGSQPDHAFPEPGGRRRIEKDTREQEFEYRRTPDSAADLVSAARVGAEAPRKGAFRHRE